MTIVEFESRLLTVTGNDTCVRWGRAERVLMDGETGQRCFITDGARPHARRREGSGREGMCASHDISEATCLEERNADIPDGSQVIMHFVPISPLNDSGVPDVGAAVTP